MENDWEKTRLVEAYLEMAKTAKFRPEAPSDGFGNIMLEPEELEDGDILAAEAERYAKRLIQQENQSKIAIIGCTNGSYNKLFVYLLNAAQMCCGTSDSFPFLKRLVKMSMDEVARIEKGDSDG